MLKTENVLWGITEAETIYQDDPDALLLLSISQFRDLLHFAAMGLGLLKTTKRVELGYIAKEPKEDVLEALSKYVGADSSLRLSPTLDSEMRAFFETGGRPRDYLRRLRYYKIVAEEVHHGGR